MDETLTLSYKNTMNLIYRLGCFCDLLDVICRGLEEEDPIAGVIDSARELITCICRDFQTDIDSAELGLEKREVS